VLFHHVSLDKGIDVMMTMMNITMRMMTHRSAQI